MASAATPIDRGRPVMGRPRSARLPDQILKWGLTILAAGILALIAYFFVRLYDEANLAVSEFRFLCFAFHNNWDVSKAIFGALPLVVGTLITSAIALVIGVSVAVA